MRDYILSISIATNVGLSIVLVLRVLEVSHLRKLLKILRDSTTKDRPAELALKPTIISMTEAMPVADAAAHAYPYCFNCSVPESRNPQLVPCHTLWEGMPDMWCSGCKAVQAVSYGPTKLGDCQ